MRVERKKVIGYYFIVFIVVIVLFCLSILVVSDKVKQLYLTTINEKYP